MDDFRYLHQRIKEGEGQHLDFKQHISSAEKIARTLVAFANSGGGQLLVGVDDQGEIVGVDPE
jgi:predicted HTH transcriptional regulator